ncbi:hypothetical protein [Microbacterium sp.]|uniref:hypothetical protein n=1 Tax=Microbacterium sp. TaxID=51671 RepID=UPI002622A881|nr:hypothetical protein [Microbacterium sp.]
MSAGWRPAATRISAAPSIGWLLLMSLWLLPILAGFGRLTWLGFAVIGALTVRTSWIITSGIYALAAAAIPFLPWSEAVTWGYPALWIVGIIHALIVSPSWLNEAWRRRQNGLPWFRPAPRTSRPSPPMSTQPPGPRAVDVGADVFGVSTADYLAPTPAPAIGPAAAATEPHSGPAPAVDAQLDPQTATVDQLAALPFMGQPRAEYVVAHRAAHPVRTLDELIALLALQPHEAAAMRGSLTFASKPSATRQPPAAGGRILDV